MHDLHMRKCESFGWPTVLVIITDKYSVYTSNNNFIPLERPLGHVTYVFARRGALLATPLATIICNDELLCCVAACFQVRSDF